jgi:hypothetical protein
MKEIVGQKVETGVRKEVGPMAMAPKGAASAMVDRQVVGIGDRRHGCQSWVGLHLWAVAPG